MTAARATWRSFSATVRDAAALGGAAGAHRGAADGQAGLRRVVPVSHRHVDAARALFRTARYLGVT